MTSVTSGQSPHSGYDLHGSSSDDTESWAFIEDMASNANAGSLGFYSPQSGSLQSYAIVGPNPSQQHAQASQAQPMSSPPAVSPMLLTSESLSHYPTGSFAGQVPASHAFADASVVSSAAANGHIMAPADMGSFIPSENIVFPGQGLELSSQPFNDFGAFLDSMNSGGQMTGMDAMEQADEAVPGEGILDLNISSQIFHTTNAPPWNPTAARAEEGAGFMVTNFQVPPPPCLSQPHPSPSIDGSASQARSPSMPKSPASIGTSGTSNNSSNYNSIAVQSRSPVSSGGRSKSPLRKVKASGVKKSAKASSFSSASASSSSSPSSSTAETSEKAREMAKFVVVTPNTISAHAGKPNPFECFEAMRATQRGRKGPLAEKDKEFALQVRRKGACFCCHARKVKCDTERPCRNCKKLTAQVPQVVCWQFPDFLPVLFPEFVRLHFQRREMEAFVRDNIKAWTVKGVERPVAVELSSGKQFSTTLKLQAKFFEAETAEVLQHWHVNVKGNEMDVQSLGSVPIGVELDAAGAGSAARDGMRKKLKEYVNALVSEPYYAEQTTDSFRHTQVPKRLLQIIHAYNTSAEAPVVRKALGIYAMHYVLSRHLTITDANLAGLQHTGLVPRNVPWVTPRVLNRQVKSVVDELLMREMQLIFEMLGKLLKPKSRREWAPCLAAFLVLCLFMEEVETAADRFVISQNEINLRNHSQRQYKRQFALKVNREVEKLPFRQVAYQFHQIYQTHVRDGAIGGGGCGGGGGGGIGGAGSGARAFNPLTDDAAMEELDGPATEMIMRLREVISGESWAELDFLSMDPILPNTEDHPYPRDIAYNYTGRLVAKFLLSFLNENYILDGNI